MFIFPANSSSDIVLKYETQTYTYRQIFCTVFNNKANIQKCNLRWAYTIICSLLYTL